MKKELGHEAIYDARQLGTPRMLVLGLQHMFAMFGATVLVPILVHRIAKAEYELGFAPQFDCVIVNDDLEAAKAEALKVIKEFLAEE